MADRTVYGKTHSENGWRMVDQGSCVWVKVPGTNVSLQIREGQPVSIMGAFAADYHVNIEPLRDADSACWTATNSVATSNHLSGTGMDLNWNGPDGKTFRYGITKERAYPGAKSKALDDLLAFYEGMIFCGGEWSIRDWMHFQMGGNTYGSQNVDKVNDFIRRKIRADGLSTYKRSGTVTPPPVVAPPAVTPPAATILARATGITQAKAEQILSQVQFALTKANCTNPRRIAAALAQWVIESGHFVYTEEIASGPETQERWKYKGRTWVQLTWLENYSGFSKWCHSLGLVPTPDYFVQRPRELAEQKWAALGPAYWWAIKYPRINEYADRGDIDNVSKWVNAPAWVDNPNKHANHEAERRAAYNKALSLGDQLLTLTTTTPPTQGDDDMSAEDVARLERKLDILVNEWGPTKKGPSRSFMAVDGSPVESPLGFLYNMDGNIWTQQLTWAYLFDVPLALRVVEQVASDGTYDGSWADSKEFNVWLREFGQAYCEGLVAFKKALVSKLALSAQQVTTAVARDTAPVTNVTNVVDTRALEAEIARLSDQFEQLRIAVNNPPTNGAEVVAGTTAQRIGNLVGAVKDGVELGLTMDQTERAALTASTRILQLENGQS